MDKNILLCYNIIKYIFVRETKIKFKIYTATFMACFFLKKAIFAVFPRINIKRFAATLAAFLLIVNLFSPLLVTSRAQASINNTRIPDISLRQNLSWGVLAINTDKPVYYPGDSVSVAMSVLDENGMMVCDAEVHLYIQREGDQSVYDLSTKNKGIVVNPNCTLKAYTTTPDLSASFRLADAGTYAMTLVAKTKNGVRSITDHFFVTEKLLPFEISRQAPTRTYPNAQYPVQLLIKANRDFFGNLNEYISEQFTMVGPVHITINRPGQEPIENLDQLENVQTTGNGVHSLQIPLSLQAGDLVTIAYTYRPPVKSPSFYQFGAAVFAEKKSLIDQNPVPIFREFRSWQIANDATAVKSGNFTKKTSTGTQSITGLGFQPKAIIFYWTNQTTDNAFLNTGASANGLQTSLGMGLASQTGTATSSRSVAICDDSTGTNGTTSDSKTRITSTSTIMMLNGGGSTAVCSTTLDGKAVLTSMDSDGFTLNWTIANASSTIIRYYALGGTDITNATTSTINVGTASSGLQSITNLGFKPDFVFYLTGGSNSYDNNIAGAKISFGFSAAATSTQQGVESFATQDAAGTSVSADTQGTASSTASFAAAPTSIDMAFRTWSLDSSGFTLNVGNPPAAASDVFFLAIKGGQHSVGTITTPSATGTQATTGVGFKPQGLFATTNNYAASNTIQNNVQVSIGSTGWATSTGVSATSSLGLIGFTDVTGDTLPSNSYDTRSNSLVKGYAPVSTDNTSPTLNFEAVPNTFDSDGFTLKYTTAVTGKQILYWAIGSAPSVSISGNVYSDEGITGLVNSRTIKLVIYSGTASTTYSTTTVASTGRYDFLNVVYSRNDVATIFLSGATEKSATVSLLGSPTSTTVNLYQSRVILRSEYAAGITNNNISSFDSDNDSNLQFTANGGTLSVAAANKLIVWTGTTFNPGGSVTTAAASTAGNPDGDLLIQTGATMNVGTNSVSVGGDFTNSGTFAKATGQVTTFTALNSGFTINNSNSFDSVVFNGSGGGWSFAANTTIDSNLTVTSGTVSGTANTTVSGGGVTGNGTINVTGGTFTVDGTGNFGGSTPWIFSNLTFGDGLGVATTTSIFSSTATVTVSSVLTISQNQILVAGQNPWVLSSGGTPFVSNGTLSASTSLFSFQSTNGITNVPSLGYYNFDFSPNSGNPSYTMMDPQFITATTTSETAIKSITFDSTNAAIYAGSGGSGKIYKCFTSTGCTSAGNWVVATTTASTKINSLAFDSTNSAIYALSGNNGKIYKCVTSTGCTSAGNWVVATTTAESSVFVALVFDSTNGAMYAGGNGGTIYKCVTSTGCTSAGNWVSGNAVLSSVQALAFDSTNSVMYAADGPSYIQKCNVSLDCTLSSNWLLATTTPGGAISLVFDSGKSAMYAGGSGKIYKCVTSTGCTSAGNWVVATTTAESSFESMTFDSTNAAIYAGSGGSGKIYKCFTSTGCTSAGNWVLNTDTSVSIIEALTYTSNGIFAGSGGSGKIYKKSFPTVSVNNLSIGGAGSATVDMATNNVSVAINGSLIVGSTGTYSASDNTTITGNLTNNGFFTHNNGTVTMNGSASVLTGTTTLYNLIIASGTTMLASANTATVTINNLLTVNSGSILNGGPSTIALKGSTPLTVNGTFIASTSLVSFQGTSNFTLPSTISSYYNLDFNATSGNPTYIFPNTAAFVLATDTPETTINSLAFDSTNGAMYAGTFSSGLIYKCVTSTGCTSAGNWVLATDTPETTINSLAFDSTNGAMYAGGNGTIYKCITSTGCTSAGNWVLATTTPETSIQSLVLDSVNGAIYAGSNPNGKIYKCVTSTGCTSAGNWVLATTTQEAVIYSLALDSTNGILYAGGGGKIYKCVTSTGCTSAGNWVVDINTSETDIEAMVYDSKNHAVYAGSGSSGVIFKKVSQASITISNNLTLSGVGAATLDALTNNVAVSVGGNLTINTGNTYSASSLATTTISGSFTNNGTFTNNTGVVVFDTTATSTISSTATTTFYNLTIVTPGKLVIFQNAASMLPVFSIVGTLFITGSSSPNGLVYIDSSVINSQWLIYFSSAQSDINYVSVKNSGCVSGSASVTYNSTMTNGGNNDTCWNFPVIIPISLGGGFAIEFGSGGGVLQGGGGSGGGGTPVDNGQSGGSVVGGGGGGGGGGAAP